MEALKTNTKSVYTFDKNVLSDKIANSIKEIEQWASNKGYQVKGSLPLEESSEKLTFHTKTSMKKIQRKMHKVAKKTTLRGVNTYIHYLSKHLYRLDQCPMRVNLSEKELSIQKARKEWVTARDAAQKTLVNYKTLKGDFYKQQ